MLKARHYSSATQIPGTTKSRYLPGSVRTLKNGPVERAGSAGEENKQSSIKPSLMLLAAGLPSCEDFGFPSFTLASIPGLLRR